MLGDSERASVFWDGFFWGTAHLVNKKGPHKKKTGQADSLCLETASEPVCFGMASEQLLGSPPNKKKGPHSKKGRSGRQLVLGDSQTVCFGCGFFWGTAFGEPT